jgi:hypothetical protein
MAGVLALKTFTVAQLCEQSGLRRSQVDPTLAELKKQQYLVVARESPVTGGTRHRPRGILELTSDATRRQEFIDRLYLLRRALISPDHSSDLYSLDRALDELDTLLSVCDCATTSEPLSLADLRKVENQLQRVFRDLGTATLGEPNVDLRRPENTTHPLTSRWAVWSRHRDRLSEIASRWQSTQQRRFLVTRTTYEEKFPNTSARLPFGAFLENAHRMCLSGSPRN